MINKYFLVFMFLTQGEQLAPSTQLSALPALLLPGLQFLFLLNLEPFLDRTSMWTSPWSSRRWWRGCTTSGCSTPCSWSPIFLAAFVSSSPALTKALCSAWVSSTASSSSPSPSSAGSDPPTRPSATTPASTSCCSSSFSFARYSTYGHKYDVCPTSRCQFMFSCIMALGIPGSGGAGIITAIGTFTDKVTIWKGNLVENCI